MLSIIRGAKSACKVHQLAEDLSKKGLLQDLDEDANKAIFKRNYLLMNALYQLQSILLPDEWLQVQAMDIQLFKQLPNDYSLRLEQDVALRCYYLDWKNYDTSNDQIAALLNSFWQRYKSQLGAIENQLTKSAALQVFELSCHASKQDIRQQWRKLALKWHPDRSSGDSVKFRQVCEAWQILR